MLRIKRTQLADLDASRWKSFELKLEHMTFELRPDLRVPGAEEAFSRFVPVLMARAGKFGFTTEFEIATFQAALLLLGNQWLVEPTHPLNLVISRLDVQAHLRAAQLLYELEKLTEDVDSA